MKKRLLLLLGSLSLAGCTESADSIAREYRNANNEHIDALMLITSEAKAQQLLVRIFKPMRDRYPAIDNKVDIMNKTWPRKELMKEFLESDGVHLYRSEYAINAQRCSLERARLRDLLEKTLEKAREEAKAKGEDPANVRAMQVCPALDELVNKQALDVLRDQLERPKLEEIFREFRGKVDPAVAKRFKEKQEIFKSPTIVLTQ